MTARILDNQMRGILILVLFLALLLNSCYSQAQTRGKKMTSRFYYGFETAFGTRTYKVTSNISELKDLFVIQEGGRAGVIAGTEAIKTRLGVGFYYSGGNVPYTFDRSEASASIIFNPLALLMKRSIRFEPYFVGGFVYHTNKFYGHYLTEDPGRINYSTSEQPFIGKISEASATMGLGFEYKIPSRYNFVHLFSEARYGTGVSKRTKHNALIHTSSKNQMMIELGIRFGAFR